MEVNVSFLEVRDTVGLLTFIVMVKRFSSWWKNHALYTGLEPVIAAIVGRCFTAKLLEGYS